MTGRFWSELLTKTGAAGFVAISLLLSLCTVPGDDLYAEPNASDIQLGDAIRKLDESLALRLIDAGASQNAQIEGVPILYLATQHNMPKVVWRLLNSGAEVDASPRSMPGVTALGVAAQNGHAECASLLLAAKANVNAAGLNGATPLIMAAQYDRKELVELLLDAKAQPDSQRADGQTALGLAAERGFERIVAVLIQRGANVNIQDGKGSAPLHHAVRKGYLPIAQLLIQAKANVEAQAMNGIRPLHAAAYKNQASVAALLLASGADPNARMREDVTPMHVAVGGGAIEVVRVLLKPADLNARDSRGHTPLDIAKKRNDARLVELLSGRSQ